MYVIEIENSVIGPFKTYRSLKQWVGKTPYKDDAQHKVRVILEPLPWDYFTDVFTATSGHTTMTTPHPSGAVAPKSGKGG